MQVGDTRTLKKRYACIFIIALAVIAYQILLTRIFSVMLYHHFAFAGISLAMLGITIGAQKVYLHPERFTDERFEEEWAKAALGFALSSVQFVVWFLYIPLFISPGIIMAVLACSLLLFAVPFTYSGICITLILTRSPAVGRLYAADLLGAALGCIVIVPLLYVLDPVSIIFFLATLSALAAWVMASDISTTASRAKRIVLILACVGALQGVEYVTGHSHMTVIWAKNGWRTGTLFQRWNTFSFVRVTHVTSPEAFGWGFGHPQQQTANQNYVDIDAGAATVMTQFDGNLKPLSYLSDDVINMGYHVRPVHSVAVIGVGGGRDILSALYFGVGSITGIELNPSIVEALTRKFADFAGHLTERPEVSLINAEARSWLQQHHPRVDMVQISLIDTWAATAAGGLTLSENRLYTLEAWKEFLGTLNPGGMLTVSRWFFYDKYQGEFYRMLSLAVSSLEAIGISSDEVSQHILAFNGGAVATVVVSPTPFTPEEVEHAYKLAGKLGFKLMAAPGFAIDEISKTITDGKATAAFYDHLPIDVTTPTDDRPFFFNMVRPLNAWDKNPDGTHNTADNNVPMVVIILFVGTLVMTGYFILYPLLRQPGHVAVNEMLPDLTYFACIGLGFMLIEISQMQRLIVFLGHPVYGLSVVLFSLLLFGGLGSFTVRSDTHASRLWQRPLLLCLVLTLTGFLTPEVATRLASQGTDIRILASAALLAPAGFCMGMMFPLGMIFSVQHRGQQSWFWGINGAVSVFASILGTLISMQYGIAAAYWLGVAAYVLCLGLIVAYPRAGSTILSGENLIP